MRNVESWNPTLDFLQQKLKVESGSVSSKDPPEIPLKRENHCSGHLERAKGFSREVWTDLSAKGKSMKRTTTQDFPKDGADRKS